MLTYREPDGSEVEEPSESYLRERVLDADPSYWEGPAGDAALVRQGDGEDADLVLIVPAEGALVRYRNFVTNAELLAATPPTGEVEWVEVYDGQETIKVGRRFLVPREMAWIAVAEFIRSGRPAVALHWEERLEIQDPD